MTQAFPQIWVLAQSGQPNGVSTQDLLGGGGQSAAGATAAQPGTGTTGTPATGGPPAATGIPPFMWLMFGLFALLILTQVMGGRKEKKRRAQMLSALGRHDKVLTIGGLLGTVVEVRDDEVVLKVDENTNTKVRVTRSAIQQVLKSADSGSSGGGGEPDIQVKARSEKAAV